MTTRVITGVGGLEFGKMLRKDALSALGKAEAMVGRKAESAAKNAAGALRSATPVDTGFLRGTITTGENRKTHQAQVELTGGADRGIEVNHLMNVLNKRDRFLNRWRRQQGSRFGI